MKQKIRRKRKKIPILAAWALSGVLTAQTGSLALAGEKETAVLAAEASGEADLKLVGQEADAPAQAPAEQEANGTAEVSAGQRANASAESSAEQGASESAESWSEQGANANADTSAGQGTGAPAETSAEQGANAPADTSAGQETNAPADTSAEQGSGTPVESSAGQEANAPADTSAGQGTGAPADTSAGQGSGTPADTSAEQEANKPAQSAAEQNAEPISQTPTEAPVEQPSTAQPDEASAETPETPMTFQLSLSASLGANQLELGANQEAFAKSLFSEEELWQGGQGNVLVYADLEENLFKPEEEKGENQKLTPEERSSLENEKAALSQWAVQNGYETQKYFALRLKKYREGDAPAGITETAEKLRLSLKISGLSENVQSAALICVRNGQAAICEDLDPALETITFDAGTFGMYALVFLPVPTKEKVENPQENPETAEPQEEPQEEPEAAEPQEEPQENPETTEPQQEALTMEVTGGNAVYQPGTKGNWNPETHSYMGGSPGYWLYEDGEGKIVLNNTGTEDLTVILSYQPSEAHQNIIGSFTDSEGKPVQELSVAAGGSAAVYLTLSGEPDPGMSGEVIGKVTWELAD